MTIAAGFVGMNGLVLCADTQETIPGYTKSKTEKIDTWEEEHFLIAVSGATNDSETLHAISQQIIKDARREYRPEDYLYGERAKELIRESVLNFFDRYIRPYPEHQESPELLIAVQSHHNQYLLSARGNIVREVEQAACIGTGITVGMSFIERFYNQFLYVDDLAILACYLVYRAKRSADGCGGNTDILVLTDKLRTQLPSHEIECLEKVFEQYDDAAASILTTIANPNYPRIEAKTDIERMMEGLLKDRDKLAKNSPWLIEFFSNIRGNNG